MPRRVLLLIRHAEAEKNLTDSFSSLEGEEPLTTTGVVQSEALGIALADATSLVKECTDNLVRFHSAPARRCALTAEVIARSSGCGVNLDWDLRTISTGAVAGLTESEAIARAPEFMRRLQLYRAGVLSAYQIVGFGEPVAEFEHRVARSIDRILKCPEPIQVIISHRSTMIAALIRFARASIDYPRHFYGYVELHPCRVTTIVVSRDKIDWIAVNIEPHGLTRLLREINAL